MEPTKLGKYTLYESLGRGGYGTVYRAREDVLEVIRAVKVLHPALAADPQFIERFQQEAKSAARLEHPHIVPVYELAEEQGRYYLAMKYLPGGSLKDLLEKQGTLPYGRALQITKQIASALDYAHKQGLVHRDVKPGNILFEEDGTARLADFGFSKALRSASSASLSATGGMIGTPQYMAPELWRGKQVTPATDVYSLACVFSEMLTGQALFEGESPPEIMTRHMLDGPQLPERWPEGVPQRLSDIILKALATKVQDRLVSPTEFVKQLEQLQKSQGAFDQTLSASKHAAAPRRETPPTPQEKDASSPSTTAERVSDTAARPAAALSGEATPDDLRGVRAPRPAAALKGEATPTPRPAAALGGEATPADLHGVREKSNLPLLASLGLIGLVGIVIVAAILLSNMSKPPQQATVPQIITKIVTATKPDPTNTSQPEATNTILPTATRTIRPSPTSTRGPTTFTGPTPPATAYLGDKWLSSIDDMLLAYIPAGEFQMGGYEYDDEQPIHTVYLDAFWMDTTEVTNAMFEQFVNETKHQTVAEVEGGGYVFDVEAAEWSYTEGADWQHPRGSGSSLDGLRDHPVVQVSWDDALAYCEWAGRRLPTEAEWEKAARGGLEGMQYPWGNQEPICQLGAENGANFGDCSYNDTIEVASFGANEYGLFDMAGNVWEWVFDWYAENYYASSPARNPTGPGDTETRVLRGGSWDVRSGNLRAAYRGRVTPDDRGSNYGFRCAR